MKPLWALTAVEASAALAAGAIAAEELARACLGRIAERDPALKAWVYLDADAALRAARELDLTPRRSPLHGIPIGIKDVIDTADMPTAHNSALFAGHRPGQDAAAVATLRAAGALIIGKTATTEFAAAGRDAPTGNPHDLTRTSGGSSAGSAAAVADSHVPLALGTQTGGSTIRPASFCGVPALKPSWGLISREGAKFYSVSLDTIGLYGRCVADIKLLLQSFLTVPEPFEEPASLRIGAYASPEAGALEPDGRAAFEEAVARVRAGGVAVTPLEAPPEFAGLPRAHKVILHREGGTAFLSLARRFGEALHDDFYVRVDNREGYSNADLVAAYDLAARCAIAFDALAGGFDAILTPSAPGTAPEGRRPGDPAFNLIWTLLRAPAINLPVTTDAAGHPIGVTLVAPRFHDERLLAVATRLEPVLAPKA
jgi:Asp-tRNA(Asn)/Glu-tRNA(Gln) amidotransferase A subunit family amidase